MKKTLLVACSTLFIICAAIAVTWLYATRETRAPEEPSLEVSQSATPAETDTETAEAIQAWAAASAATTPEAGEVTPTAADAATAEPAPAAPVAASPDANAATATTTASATATPTLHDPFKQAVTTTSPNGPRVLGKDTAPVTMLDFSSLTCPHCAHAHKDILPRLITDYVERGQLRIVFMDFPLNKQALDASKMSRCVGLDSYLSFVTMLFGSIEQWAYAGNHAEGLVSMATLTGLPRDQAEACLSNTALEEAILSDMQIGRDKYKVESTPTFIFNEGAITVRGARDYSDFTTAMESLLAGTAKQGAQ